MILLRASLAVMKTRLSVGTRSRPTVSCQEGHQFHYGLVPKCLHLTAGQFYIVVKTESYLEAKSDQQRRRRPYSKNQPFGMTISLCVQNQLAFGCVLADSWYASAKNMRWVRLELKPDFIFPLKSNRQLALSRLALAELICSYVNHQLQNCNRMTDIYNLAFHVECHF